MAQLLGHNDRYAFIRLHSDFGMAKRTYNNYNGFVGSAIECTTREAFWHFCGVEVILFSSRNSTAVSVLL